MMRRHLQDYSFKSTLRRGEECPPQAYKPFESRVKAPKNVSPPRIASEKVPQLRLSAIQTNVVTHRSQSSRAPAVSSMIAQHPSAATSRTHGSTGMWNHQSHSNQLARLSAEASQSSRMLGSLNDKIEATKASRPRLPLLKSHRTATERRPLWLMAPSIPKLFASLVMNRGGTGLAAVDERLKNEQMQSEGSDETGRIGLEHWMEFCRETDTFSKLSVAPSDCIHAFRRSVEAAGSNDSALARKVGLVMNLEAFCGCIVILAELAGALPVHSQKSRQESVLHAVWDCDADTSKACSLLLLRLLTAAPGMAPPKAASLSLPPAALEPPRDALPPTSVRQSDGHFTRPQAPSLPPLSASPRKSTRRHSSPLKHHSSLAPHPPLPRKPSFAFTDDPESSVTSSPSKSKPASFKSSALTSSPPAGYRQRRSGRARDERVARSSSHHIVDVATGSEFLRWFQDKLTQIGSDGLAYPVRIVAVQVCRALEHACAPPNPPCSSIDQAFRSP
jgi:hypothetical protein